VIALPEPYGAAQKRNVTTHVTYAATAHATLTTDARYVLSTQNASTASANVNLATTKRMPAQYNVFQSGVILNVDVDRTRNQLAKDSNATRAKIIATDAQTTVDVKCARKSLYSTELNVSAMVGSSRIPIRLLMKDASAQKVLKRKMECA